MEHCSPQVGTLMRVINEKDEICQNATAFLEELRMLYNMYSLEFFRHEKL